MTLKFSNVSAGPLQTQLFTATIVGPALRVKGGQHGSHFGGPPFAKGSFAFPCLSMVSERSLLSRVRFAAPNSGAPWTAAGHSEGTPSWQEGKAHTRTASSGNHFAAKLAPFFTAIDTLRGA